MSLLGKSAHWNVFCLRRGFQTGLGLGIGIFLALFAFAGNLSAAPVSGTVLVSSGSANVRARPGAKYTIVANLANQQSVMITGRCGEWLQIALPANGSVWVASNYVKDGKLTASVRLRSGPGTGYESYGAAPAGTAVKLRAMPTPLKYWVALEPGDTLALRGYISKALVKCDAAALRALPEIAFDATVEPPPDPVYNQLELLFVQPGKTRTVSGYIYRLDKKILSITNALYVEKDGALEPAAYLAAPDVALPKEDGAKVKLSGVEYQVVSNGETWDLPVIVVKKVTPQP